MSNHRYVSARRRKFEALLSMLRRHTIPEVRHYAVIQEYPRTLRAAALVALREKGAA